MDLILYLLAAIGSVAVLRRLVLSLFRAARYGAYTLYAREIAANRIRRGDITGVEEARGWEVRARRGRRQAVLWASLWLALFVLPVILTTEPLMIFAVYPVIWFIPTEPLLQESWRPGDTYSGGEDS